MKEVFGDFWDYPADVKCITTNGSIRRDGLAVMGRGIAYQATYRVPGIAYDVAAFIRRVGLEVGRVREVEKVIYYAFPVKFEWHQQADLGLIRRSCEQLQYFAIALPAEKFLLPRPGCGNGQRHWVDEVEPICRAVLPDNVLVIERL